VLLEALPRGFDFAVALLSLLAGRCEKSHFGYLLNRKGRGGRVYYDKMYRLKLKLAREIPCGGEGGGILSSTV